MLNPIKTFSAETSYYALLEAYSRLVILVNAANSIENFKFEQNQLKESDIIKAAANIVSKTPFRFFCNGESYFFQTYLGITEFFVSNSKDSKLNLLQVKAIQLKDLQSILDQKSVVSMYIAFKTDSINPASVNAMNSDTSIQNISESERQALQNATNWSRPDEEYDLLIDFCNVVYNLLVVEESSDFLRKVIQYNTELRQYYDEFHNLTVEEVERKLIEVQEWFWTPSDSQKKVHDDYNELDIGGDE